MNSMRNYSIQWSTEKGKTRAGRRSSSERPWIYLKSLELTLSNEEPLKGLKWEWYDQTCILESSFHQHHGGCAGDFRDWREASQVEGCCNDLGKKRGKPEINWWQKRQEEHRGKTSFITCSPIRNWEKKERAESKITVNFFIGMTRCRAVLFTELGNYNGKNISACEEKNGLDFAQTAFEAIVQNTSGGIQKAVK